MAITKTYHCQIHKIHKQEKNPESSKGKKVLNLQGKTDQVCSRPTHRNLAAQKGVAGYTQCAESENMQPRTLYRERQSFKMGEIKSFPDKQKLKKFVTTKPRNFKGDSLRGEKMKIEINK